MTEIIRIESGELIDFESLPENLKKKIRLHAEYDIIKDKLKDDIKAGRIDVNKYLEQWLKSRKSERTRLTYERAIMDLFSFIQKIGIAHPLLIRAEHVDQFILELEKLKLSSNSIRLKVTACSSFYSMLKRYGHITSNPFIGANLPKKQYKKAIKPDQKKTIPVMNEDEYKTIIDELERMTKTRGKHVKFKLMRQSAAELLPAVRVMADYGLRVGAIPSVEIKDNQLLFTTKGNKAQGLPLKQGNNLHGKPFKDYKIITIQKAFARVTHKLHEQGKIRHPYSCHDLRHYFAVNHYQHYKDIVALMFLMGHASINVTMIYLQSMGLTIQGK